MFIAYSALSRWASIGFAIRFDKPPGGSESQMEGRLLVSVIAVGLTMIGYAVFELLKERRK